MNNQLFNLQYENIDKVLLSKDIFEEIVGITIITKTGDKMVLRASDLHDFPILFERKFDMLLEKSEKVETISLKIQSIDIVERDELFRPVSIKVTLDNGQILNVDNKVSFVNDSIELLKKGNFKLSFREMKLCEYFLINFAKKYDFTFGKLRDEVSFGSMLYKEFLDEATFVVMFLALICAIIL